MPASTATAPAAPVRHLAATAANGDTYTVVIEPAGAGSCTVRLEWKHAYGTDRKMWAEQGRSYEAARELANTWWTAARNRFHGK